MKIIFSTRKDERKPLRAVYTSTTDYNLYKLASAQKVTYIVLAAAALFATGFIFFRNFYISALWCFLSPVYPILAVKRIIKKRKASLTLQFRDALYSISSSLSAGNSVERAFEAALSDLLILYPDKNTDIIKEFELISRKIKVNETIESALKDFAVRASIDDITCFADVFFICKSTGGNLVEVIRNTCNILNQKMDVRNEIEILVTEQKISQRILSVMPFGLLILIMTSSPDYIEPLYTPKGNAIMSFVLLLLIASYFIGAKITDINI